MMTLESWIDVTADSDFSIANIPFGIITTRNSREKKRAAVAIGDHVLDLDAFAEKGGFSELPVIREKHVNVTTKYPTLLKDNEDVQKHALFHKRDVKTHLPMQIGDYTDFYAGLIHATNAGIIFRGPANALQKNYKHIPVGYHGRASSVVVSGTPIVRPLGQVILNPDQPESPTLTACRRLDIELELGAFMCSGNEMGSPIPISTSEENIFGLVLLNDWSARDIQAWEAVPLGPFNSKNFGTTISPWVVLMDALEPFRTKKLDNDREIRKYLKEAREDTIYDIKLEVDLTTPTGDTTTITQTTGANLLWSFPQMIAHHTIGGCPLKTGDLFGSGTISGKEPGSFGSLLEQTEGGKKEIMLAGMDVRKFLKDGDTITLRGQCGSENKMRVGFGECVGRIESALSSHGLD